MKGFSFPLGTRVTGVLFFVLVTSVFAYVWLDNPKFVAGPIDAPEIFMTLVTLGMVTLGALGLLVNLARTEILNDGLKWGIILHRALPFSEIDYVHSVSTSPLVLRVVDRHGIRYSIWGTSRFRKPFLQLQQRFPHPSSPVHQVQKNDQ
jgi:hypothetical protein